MRPQTSIVIATWKTKDFGVLPVSLISSLKTPIPIASRTSKAVNVWPVSPTCSWCHPTYSSLWDLRLLWWLPPGGPRCSVFTQWNLPHRGAVPSLKVFETQRTKHQLWLLFFGKPHFFLVASFCLLFEMNIIEWWMIKLSCGFIYNLFFIILHLNIFRQIFKIKQLTKLLDSIKYVTQWLIMISMHGRKN